MCRGGGTGEAGEATASPEFRGFTTEKFLASWIYERGNFSCFTGKKLIPPPLAILVCIFENCIEVYIVMYSFGEIHMHVLFL